MKKIKFHEMTNKIEVLGWIDHDEFFGLDSWKSDYVVIYKDKPICERPVSVTITIETDENQGV